MLGELAGAMITRVCFGVGIAVTTVSLQSESMWVIAGLVLMAFGSLGWK